MGAQCGCEEKQDGANMENSVDSTSYPVVLDEQVKMSKGGDVKEEKATREPLKKEEGRQFAIVITKAGRDDRLGMDVKHIRGDLEVVQIFEEGAIARTNAAKPQGEELRIGDVIKKVNGIAGSDQLMVAECKEKQELRLEVIRR
eukprot:gnl/TRDRNA2_/TRDRNA2_91996_c0_seq1.p2 gnl/TRDRNA2_/TRDRNA2_91996_c0~~gnl/TRDRNA2_/TRDRNA2_91996_c0_seq1.p2  ORF type:complete len:144 (-),score=46.65 gnl/TRDRNA2_/TRDRNA2_91996_c0_seq1:126-557(-)